MVLLNVVWTLIAMSHHDNLFGSDSESDGFGPAANEIPVTATSTWDVLPNMDEHEHINNQQSVPSSSNSTSINGIAQTSDR